MSFYPAKILGLLFVLLGSQPVKAELPAEQTVETIVLGGGVGALTSAVYLARSGITPVVIEGHAPGGTITQSLKVQNWPGEIEISGYDLTEKIRKQAQENGAVLASEEVVSVDFSQKPFLIVTQDVIDKSKKKLYRAHSCIIAMGAKSNLLQIPGESEYWSKGVYNCAVCDGALYKNKTVAVIGGGDAAILEADYLSQIAKKVYVLVRKDKLKGFERQRAENVLKRSNVEVLYDTIATEICGDKEKIQGIAIQNLKTEQNAILDLDAVFLAIGSTPNSQLFQNQLDLDASGYIILKKDMETSIPGVFAIGDIIDPIYRQAISAAGDGAKAAIQAHKHVSAAQGTKESLPKLSGSMIPKERSKKYEEGIVLEVIDKEQLSKILQSARIPVLVDFYATWCGPCRYLTPYFESWAKELKGKVLFCKVNVDKAQDLSAFYQIRAMPTMIIFDEKGKEKERQIGSNNIISYVKDLK
jgi:thioredoxin reductase (NADPH)